MKEHKKLVAEKQDFGVGITKLTCMMLRSNYKLDPVLYSSK